MKPPLLVHGMHGLGDNIHQRALVRALMPAHDVWLETSWPCIYHDLVPGGLHLVRRPVALRTQLKNAARESDHFVAGPPAHHHTPAIQISYNRNTIGDGTILSAMFARAGIVNDYKTADYRLALPDEWSLRLFNEITHAWPNTGKPLLVYRPLTARPEWRGGQIRNANADDYAAVFAAIRDEFYVVSVADLEPAREWIVGPQLRADATLHKGELTFETLAALFAQAACVYTSSGFASILAPAVGTPCISVQGGFEPASWHSDGVRFAPYLGIDPLKPCACGTSACTNPCDKKLDVPAAQRAVMKFVSDHCGISSCQTRPISEMFAPPEYPAAIPPSAHTLRRGRPRPGNPQWLGHVRRPGVKA